MRNLRLISLLLVLVSQSLLAQEMSIEDFVRLKGRKVEKQKIVALLDLKTEENGFTVLGNGNRPVDVQQQEGFIRLLVPHKTTHLTLRHATYGQLSWMVPGGKSLRKGRHYQASLYTTDPTREFKPTHQWAVLRISPQNALLQIDSVTRKVHGEITELYLPLGEHKYKVEAPFYAPEEGSFTLTDSARTNLSVTLMSGISYLTVKAPWQGGSLYIDGAHILKEDTSLRLAEGYHRVSYYWGSQCFYDSLLYVGNAQKVVLEPRMRDVYPREQADLKLLQPVDSSSAPAGEVPVKLNCQDPEAEILVDRESVGKGSWEGTLHLGFHLLGTRKDAQEGTPVKVVLDTPYPQEFSLQVPGTGFGVVNVHCNVEGALILVDGQDCGKTPQLLQLDASRSYEIILSKAGYKDRKYQVRPRSNQQTDLYVQLKKR